MFTREHKGLQWTWVSRKDVPFCEESHPTHDCVSIIGKHRSTGETPVILQHRPAVGGYIYELPAGKIDAGEDILVAAGREMKEETGLDLEDALYVPWVFPSCGIIDESHAVVMGWVSGEPTTAYTEEYEDIEILMCNDKQLIALLEQKTPVSLGLAHYIMGIHQNQYLVKAMQ
jgi:ADP-ribose pyrophosphatase